MTAALPDRRKSERKNQPGSVRLVGMLIRRVLPDGWDRGVLAGAGLAGAVLDVDFQVS